MTANIIVFREGKSLEKYLEDNFAPANFTYMYVGEEEGSIKIAEIHTLVSQLSITAKKPRLVMLKNAERLTTPAQNALLKILEEPPMLVEFVLTTPSPSSLLPTIRSRCTVTKLINASSPNIDSLATIKEALSLSMGERITFADSMGKKRDVNLTFIDSVIASVSEKIKQGGSTNQLKFLAKIGKQALNTKEALLGNVNVGLAMQDFFLNLPILR